MTSGIKLTPASLATVEAFHGLSSNDCDSILPLLNTHTYQASKHIITLGEHNREVFFILSGSVRITTFTKHGKEVSFRDMCEGQMFGQLAAIDGGERSTNVVALKESNIASTSHTGFFQILNNYPSVNQFVLLQLTDLIRKLGDRIVEYSALSVKNRIHAEILRIAKKNLHDDNYAEITPAPTHQDIANRISTHREAVSREISELTKEGIIKRNEGKFIIQDITKLEALLDN